MEYIMRIPNPPHQRKLVGILIVICPSCGEVLRFKRGMANDTCPGCGKPMDCICDYWPDHVETN